MQVLGSMSKGFFQVVFIIALSEGGPCGRSGMETCTSLRGIIGRLCRPDCEGETMP